MLLYAIVVFLVLADQFTKFLILSQFTLGESLPIFPHVFHLTFVQNTGIAFGLFERNPGLLTAVVAVCVLGLVIYSPFILKKSRLEITAFALILGGAIGNLIDRIRFGWVVDFFDFRIWPVFNVADSAITIGVILFAWTILFPRHDKKKSS